MARHVVRAQYAAGTVDGRPVAGYRQEEGVAADSTTETYVAIRADGGKLAMVRRSLPAADGQVPGRGG